jgi:hypothetical protein
MLDVGERFPDDCHRLVRDMSVGSPVWEALYHRGRNASEGRNASHEHWNLKRVLVHVRLVASQNFFPSQTRADMLNYLLDFRQK